MCVMLISAAWRVITLRENLTGLLLCCEANDEGVFGLKYTAVKQ